MEIGRNRPGILGINEQHKYMTPICNQYVNKFKTGSQYKDEWNMLQCHVDEFSKMHMNDSSIDIPLLVAMNDLNNRPQCFISTNIESIEPYDLSIEKKEQRYMKKKNKDIGKNIETKLHIITLMKLFPTTNLHN